MACFSVLMRANTFEFCGGVVNDEEKIRACLFAWIRVVVLLGLDHH